MEEPIQEEKYVIIDETDGARNGLKSPFLGGIEEENGIEECLDDIFPDHYYDNGKIPVFKPTMEQFHCFSRFVKSIDSYGMKTGIVKIIPPNEWLEKLPNYTEKIKTIRLRHPIEQHIVGNGGCFRQTNVEKRQTYNLPKWRKLCESPNHLPPARRGETRKIAYNDNICKKPENNGCINESFELESNQGKALINGLSEKNVKKKMKTDSFNNETELTNILPSEIFLKKEETETNCFLEKKSLNVDIETTDNALETDSNEQTPKKKVKKNGLAKNKINQSDDCDFDGFDYKITNPEEYTIERCKELERIYWKTITYNNPLYGADMPGSLFDDSVKEWNVSNLDNILNKMDIILPGVNTSYLYLGMWKATFSWHVEDMDLYSINYLHFGAPKQWYSICQKDASRFEDIMRRIFPNDYKTCSQFLRHKTFSVSPSVLAQNNIDVNRLVQHQGEFVITFPYGYHSGYNLGYNCAESVNFASYNWLEIGRNAKRCKCIPDSVHINVDDAIRRISTNIEEKNKESKKRKVDKKEFSGLKGLKKPKLLHQKKADCCVLCPNESIGEPLIVTNCGGLSHRICALYIPETYVVSDTALSKDVVHGIDMIEKARFKLRCLYCRSIKGACFQCSYPKCFRSYHATCAASAGVLVESFQLGLNQQFFFSCKFHRPKRPRPEKLEDDPHIHKFATEVTIGDVIQAQYTKGDIFSGIVRENRIDENIVLIEISSRDLYEVEYKWILAPPLRTFPPCEFLTSNNDFIKINGARLNKENIMPINISPQEKNGDDFFKNASIQENDEKLSTNIYTQNNNDLLITSSHLTTSVNLDSDALTLK
ncbi:hypothetical protein T552_02645 [Pneumocystis carinii B80]|uniref:[histone H3]-trimethyl-L-lysine(9) demethylase n=1 Tax=Pneumocystis carinii (strain B80) TaxID=1408658 RepID=A0A0W4ZE32_PNEC8|nr:hypothetical protein T552_02645 [Pneumocystis carinii B80]KTW26636.1 hypothetical protein T552_02645 [Pneumocystis carinii B80]